MTKQMTLEQLLRETIPYLRDEASHYEDDGSNEPLELARRIETALESGAHLNAAKGEAVATDKLTITAPEQIYLQISDEPEHRNEEFRDDEVTWCSESVLECEVEYVRTDLAHPTSPDVVRDAERYRWLRDQCDTTTGFLLGHRIEAEEWDAAIDAAMAAREGVE